MTTTQAAPNGHHPLPPPLPVETPAQQNPPGVTPTKEKHLGYSYPSRYNTDTSPPLPERCQFFFSGGRQCRMLRSEIHPNLCPFHAARENELFDPPHHGWPKVNTRPDLPELYCACEELGTAAGVNRALAHVFRMLALRRITRQEAATFGHLAQLLLRTISAMRMEAADPIGLLPELSQNDEVAAPMEPAPASPACPDSRRQPAKGAGSTSAGSTDPYKRPVPDFGSMLSASRTALGSTAPHTEVPPNHPLIDNVQQLPHNQHLRNRGTLPRLE